MTNEEEKLSEIMKNALLFTAEQTDGKLKRYPGGFWAGTVCDRPWNKGKNMFGTSTVNGLVSRGLMEYCAWKEGKRGKFPVEAIFYHHKRVR